MPETRLPLSIPPGLYRNGTRLQAAGRWYDGDLIRFYAGTVQPVGGWRVTADDLGAALGRVVGTPRAALAWRADDGTTFVAIGTIAPARLYVLVSGVLHDITPEGLGDGRATTTTPPPASAGVATAAYGEGDYSNGDYGAGSTFGLRQEADLWQLDTFGDWLVAVPSMDGTLYVWEGDITQKAAPVEGATPSNRAVVVTPERYALALGAGGNVRRVQWPSQEKLDDWVVSADNTAGGVEVATNGAFLTGRRTRKETLLWTDTDMHTATYIGGTFLYRFDQAGEGCGLISPNACATFDASAIWMGRDSFFVYDGFVQPLPCDVQDEVFTNINREQLRKVWCMTIAEFGEVWFFYPSGQSEECDRYAAFSYREKHWSLGQLARTAGVDARATPHPLMLSADGTVYEHENGQDRAGAVPYLESGPVRLGAGDQVMRVQKVYPDEKTRGDVRVELVASMASDGAETSYGPFDLADETDVRLSARLVRLRIEEARPTNWRVGEMALGAIPQGRR